MATISNTAGSQGLASTRPTGTTEITAALNGITSPGDTLTVTAAALTSIAVAPASPSVAKGLTEQFSATGTYTDGTTANLTSQVSWTSGTPAVATISNTAGSQGLASALSVGTTGITAALSGVTSSTDTLTVTAAASVATNLAISPNTGISSGVTDTGAVTFSGKLATTGMTVDIFDTSTDTDLGDATVTGTSFSLALNLAEGSHVLRARAMLNGTYADAFFDVLVDLTAPTSHVVNSLGTSQTSDTFPVSVSFTDPAGAGGAPASGVAAVELWDSVNNGAFSLYQTMDITPTDSGTVTFAFTGQDRNIYAFHSVAIDAAGNTESKNSNTIEASTSVPDLHPPATQVLTTSMYSSSTGVFTLNWSGTDPDQNTGTPAGSIALVDIYVVIDGGSATLIGQISSPTSTGDIYSGSLTYSALADDTSHNYSFYSIGIDDEQKAQAVPAPADQVTFTDIKYSSPLAVENLVVEKGIAERSFIQYLDVNFNQTASTSRRCKPGDRAANPQHADNSYLELFWYGEGTVSTSSPKGSVNLFGSGTTAKVTLTGNDLSINFGANGITSLLTETGVSGTGRPTTNFGDGWYALGVDTTGGGGQVFWEPFFRLFGSATGDTTVSGPYTTAGTDAYVVYNAEGETGAAQRRRRRQWGREQQGPHLHGRRQGRHRRRGFHPGYYLPGVPVVRRLQRRVADARHSNHAKRSASLAPGGHRCLASRGPGSRRGAQTRERASSGRQPGHNRPGPGSRRCDQHQPDG